MKQTKINQFKSEDTMNTTDSKIQDQLTSLKEQLNLAQEKEKRILADYQNLLRRSQTEKLAFIKMANEDLCQVLLQPLEHLSLASTSIKNQGLDMVINEFWRELHDFGLFEIEVLGKKFDLQTMEAVEKKGDDEKVVEVVRKGYTLNGAVIQHAQVVLA
jgi:molecular chaperone GrpE